MQTTSIVSAATRFFSLKAKNLSQLKKRLFPAALFLSFAFFAAPATAQVTITTPSPGGALLTNPYTVTFTTAQTGLTASNFTVTGTATGAYVSNVSGSGTSWTVQVTVPTSFQAAGTITLNMVNSTGLSPGVTGLPVSGPTLEVVNYPLTASLALSSTNSNAGYAKNGDKINYTFQSTYYLIYDWSVTVAGQNQNGYSSTSPMVQGQFTLGSGTAQGPIAYSWSYTNQFNESNSGSGNSSIIFDNIPPTCTISAPSAAIASGDGTKSVVYTVTYADANFNTSNLTASGITLNTTGTATGTMGVSGSGTSYTVTISNITGNGTLGISVGAGYATDKAGNADAGAGPSATTAVVPDVAPSIGYASPQGYAVNTAISPLTPTITTGTKVFAGISGANGVAIDYNGNAYALNSSYNIVQYPSGGGLPVTAYNANGVITNVAVAPISSGTSTLIFGISGAQLESMDNIGGVFQSPVTIGTVYSGNSPVAATHPASGPDVLAVFTDNNSNINFTARTSGVYSSPAIIANAQTTSFLAVNNYQGAVELAFVGEDNNLYYATYSGGAWSAVAPWAAPNISMSGIGAFALDAQGNVWYSSGATLYEITPASTGGIAMAALPAAATGIAFDISGNIYVNCGTEIVELQTPTGFLVTPVLPAGLSINSATGIISGTPSALTGANNYTVTATAGTSNLTANVNIQIITTPSLSYGSPVNATVGTAIATVTPTSGSIMAQHYNSTPVTFAGATSPTGLAVDGTGNVYVAENGGSVVKIPAGGGLQTPIASANTSAPLATDGSGNLYLTATLGVAIGFAIFQPGASSAEYQNSSQGPFITVGTGMSVDAAGNVYTAGGPIRSDYTAGLSTAVYEYIDPLNTQPTSYGQGNALAIGTGFTSVSGLAADAAGDVYVADGGAGTIDVIPASRGQWTTLASGLGAPANICIDGGGNLYFSDNVTNTIREIPAGSSTPVIIASGLGSITGLGIDETGKLYAADNTNNVIDVFSPTGGYYISPVLPAGLSFSGSTGIISGTPNVASTAANYTITAYNTIGSVSATQSIAATASLPTLSYAGATGFTTGSAKVITPASTGVAGQGYATAPVFMDNQFGAPLSVAVDTLLHVYVADPWNFDGNNFVNGDENQLVFTEGNVAPLFYTPQSYQLTSVAVDSAGNVYINKYPSGLSRLVPTGNTYVETKLVFGYGIQVAVDSKGNVSAASGTSVLQSPGGGTGAITTIASGFSMLSGIALDGLGNIFVADSVANALYKIPAGSSTPAVVATGFNSPDALAVDGTGNVFIADVNNGVIKELPAGGGSVTTVLSGFKAAKGVAVDVNGVLYVADESFAQVRKYVPTGGYYISPSLPAGLSFNNTTGVISGTPTAVTAVKNYKITAYNLSGSTQTIVTFGVAAPSSNLANLTMSAGSLSPAFATATTGYSASIPYSTTQITVTPTPADPNATITVNGAAVVNGSASGAINLSVGANTITVVVTASDHSSTQTYTVTATRAAQSSNALLSNVGIGYVVSGTTTEAVVTPTTADPTATVTVNGVAVVSGSASNPIPLNPGSNTIAIVVTAQNGLTKMTYTITVYGPLGSTSSLSGLTISAGTLSPAFAPGTTSYTDNVTNSVTSVTVTPTTTDPNASVTVDAAAVTSGTASSPIALPVGNTIIPTVVTAQDGVTTTTYTITVTRAPSSNAALSNLAISSGTLNPGFASATNSYTAAVANAVTTITVTPTTADPTATVTVNGSAVSSGSPSQSFTLVVGANTITTTVTAQDGVTQQTYTLIVTRAGLPPTFSYSSPQTYMAGTAITPLTPTSSGVASLAYSSAPVILGSGFSGPTGVAVDGAGNLYVADRGNKLIKMIPAGNGTPAILGSGFNSPYGVAVDAAGDVYVADYGASSVYKIPAGNGTPVTIGSGFNTPTGVAIDGAGNVYVADYGNNKVKMIPAGSNTPVVIGSGFSEPVGVAVDASGNVYVGDRANNAVKEIPAGNGTPVVLGTGFNNPFGVAVDASGNVYVGDYGNNLVKMIPVGSSTPVAIGGTGFSHPDGVAVDGVGNVYLADVGNNAAKQIKPTGGFYIGPFLPAGLSFNNTTGVISGTPMASSPATTYTVTAYDSFGGSTGALSIKVNSGAPSLSYTSPQTYVKGMAITPLTPTSSGVAAVAHSSSTVIIGSGFSAPTGVAVDAAGNLYVADRGNKEVKKIPAGNGTPVIIGSGFNSPYGLTVDAAGDVYVADQGANAVYKIPAGNGTSVTIGSGFNTPTGVAIDAAGNLYVADYGNNEVKMIPAGSNTPVVIGSGFSEPVGVAVDASGNVYVGDRANNAVKEIPAGNGTPIILGTGFNNPFGVAVDASGNVYVGDYGNNLVKMIPVGSNTPVAIGGTGFSHPDGVAADGAGNVYVADVANNAAKQIKPTGGFYIGPFLPAGLAFNNTTGVISGTPTATSPATTYTVTAYNSFGGSAATVNILVNGPPSLSYSSPHIYTAGTAITPLTPTSSYLAGLAYSSSPVILGSGFSYPSGVAVDAAGNLYVADRENKEVKKIPAGNGTPVILGSGFTSPYGVAVDAAGDVYVADYGANAVYKIPAGNGTPVTIGSGFNTPTGVAIDAAGNLYVADYGNNKVKKIPAGSNTPVVIGSGFSEPVGVAVDAAGNVYVGDRANNAVKEIPGGSGTPVVLGSGFNNPFGVAVDASGNVYVGDYNNNLVKMIPVGSSTPVAIGGTGFSHPDGVAVDGAGNVYVADVGNNAAKQIKPMGGVYIAPFLPAGLAFNNTTGALSGTAAAASPATTYTVTAYNSYGSGTAAVNITVAPPLPTVSYTSPQTYTEGTAITPLTPTSANVAGLAYSSTPVVIGSGFSGPSGVAVDAAGNVYVADKGNKEVKKIPAGNGTPVILGSGFNTPYGVAVDAAGDVYVADQGANAVYKIPAGNGTPVTIGSGFNAPTGVAIDAAGNLYVADYGNNKVKMILAGSNTPVVIGSGFSEPVGVAVDASGNVYVGDRANNAVKEIPAGNGTPIVLGTGFNNPFGVAVDASGNVYVGDYGNNLVKMIPAGSSTPVAIGGTGFSHPDGVAADGAGNVYVANVGNNTVNQVKPAGGFYIGPFLPAGLAFNNTTGVVSGTPAAASPATTYTVTAYSSFGSSTATLSITVLSNNASLAGLVLSSGPLSPVFATGTISYTATVASTVTSVTVTPTTSVSTATVTVNGTAVTSGTASQGLPLVQGANTITTLIKAQSGATETYTITVTQTAPGAAFRPVNITALTDSTSMANDGIMVHQGVSPNGDGINDFLVIEGITNYPDNHLMIINRNGALVFQSKGYDNSKGVFDGHSNINGRMQAPGTYFYALDYNVNGVLRHRAGFIVLKY